MRRAVVVMVLFLGACLSRTMARAIVDVALSGSEIVCVKTSPAVDVEDVARACGILSKLDSSPVFRDILVDLIAEREAARRSGFTWAAGRDAGAEGGAR